MPRLPTFGPLSSLVAFGLSACTPRTTSPRAGSPAIEASAIERHTSILADDSLEGRGTGQRGYQKAADYVAGQFKQYGLEPGATDGSYFEPVRFREAVQVEGSASVAITGPEPARLTQAAVTRLAGGRMRFGRPPGLPARIRGPRLAARGSP